MAVKTYNFEGGAAGQVLATTDSGSGDPFDFVLGPPAGGVKEYNIVTAAHGSKSLRFANRATGGDNYFGWNAAAAAAAFYGRIYFLLDATPGQSTRLIQFRESQAGATVGAIWVTLAAPSWYPSLRLASDAALYSFNHSQSTLAINTFYRLEWFLQVNGASGPTMQAKLFLGDSATPMEDSGTQTGVSNGTGATWGSIRHGIIDGSLVRINDPSAAGYIYMDAMTAFDTTWPGPAPNTQYQRPNADQATALWTPTPASPTTLYDKLDETSADDADYITGVAV